MEDFTNIFENIDICCLCPDFLDGSAECHWTSERHFGRWNAETTAGGDIIKTGIITVLICLYLHIKP